MNKPQQKIILGIDPGTAMLGYGVISKLGNRYQLIDVGCVTSKSTVAMADRLLKISESLSEIIAKHKPHEIAVEELFFAKNVKTALTVAQARGVVLLEAAKANLVISEYKPNQIKLAVCGYGKADKRQVQDMVRVLLKLKEIVKPDDAADALAVAICHAQCSRELVVAR